MEASLTTDWDLSAWAPGCERIDFIHPTHGIPYLRVGISPPG
jgi:hypothetical protein